MSEPGDTLSIVPLDPDSTGPLPTHIEAEVEAAQAAAEEETSEVALPESTAEIVDDSLPVEPKNAPGRETVPVDIRADSDTFTGQNDFLSWGSRSDVGLVRGHNEDSMLVDAPLFCVCDGMGGHAAGEVASSIAIRTISETAPTEADDIMLGVAIEKANLAVIDAVQRGEGKPGMGCTATAVYIEGSRMAIGHVGDSRVYILHAGTLVRVTHDHSFVEELVDAGEITVGEARLHPSRSIITRALGSDPEMYADHFTLDVEMGDRILICSDGLSSMVSDAHIETVAVSNVTPQGAADNLVADALAEGGHDNITVICIDVLDDGVVREHRRTIAKSVVRWIIAGILVLLLGAGSAALFVNNSYYVGNNHGTVGIYQGINTNFMGMELSHLTEETSVSVSDLPDTVQDQLVAGISVGSLEEAKATVEGYREQIDAEKTQAKMTAEDAQNTGEEAKDEKEKDEKDEKKSDDANEGGE